MKLPADVYNISEDEVTCGNVVCPDCVLVEVDRDSFNII